MRRVDRAGALVLQLESLLRGRLAETRRDWQQLRSDVKQEPEQQSADGFPPKNGNSRNSVVRSIQWLGYLVSNPLIPLFLLVCCIGTRSWLTFSNSATDALKTVFTTWRLPSCNYSERFSPDEYGNAHHSTLLWDSEFCQQRGTQALKQHTLSYDICM